MNNTREDMSDLLNRARKAQEIMMAYDVWEMPAPPPNDPVDYAWTAQVIGDLIEALGWPIDAQAVVIPDGSQTAGSISATSTIHTPEAGVRTEPWVSAYNRQRTQLRIHSMILELYERSGLKQAQLARMAGKSTAVINRMISMPGNHTLNQLTDVLFALGAELSDQPEFPLTDNAPNAGEPAWLNEEAELIAAAEDKFGLDLQSGTMKSPLTSPRSG